MFFSQRVFDHIYVWGDFNGVFRAASRKIRCVARSLRCVIVTLVTNGAPRPASSPTFARPSATRFQPRQPRISGAISTILNSLDVTCGAISSGFDHIRYGGLVEVKMEAHLSIILDENCRDKMERYPEISRSEWEQTINDSGESEGTESNTWVRIFHLVVL